MKRILRFILFLLLVIVFVSCDNNKGPFEIRREGGKLILYSDNKLAKGWVDTNINDGNVVVKSKSIEYKKGIPTGNFKIYDKNGLVIIEAKLKNKEKNIFQGQMVTIADDKLRKAIGEFSLDTDYLIEGISYEDIDLPFESIINGDIEVKYKNNQIKYRGKYKNSKRIGEHVSYFENGNLEAKGEYREDGSANRVEYYMNGNLALRELFSDYNNRIHNGIYERYYESGQLEVREKYFENGDSIYEEFYFNGNLKKKCNYRNYDEEKVLNGEYIEYYENGKVKANAYYNNNMLEKFAINYSNGVLGFLGDRKKGNGKMYLKNGQLLLSLENGKYYMNGVFAYNPYGIEAETMEVKKILENLPYSNYVAE